MKRILWHGKNTSLAEFSGEGDTTKDCLEDALKKGSSTCHTYFNPAWTPEAEAAANSLAAASTAALQRQTVGPEETATPLPDNVHEILKNWQDWKKETEARVTTMMEESAASLQACLDDLSLARIAQNTMEADRNEAIKKWEGLADLTIAGWNHVKANLSIDPPDPDFVSLAKRYLHPENAPEIVPPQA